LNSTSEPTFPTLSEFLEAGGNPRDELAFRFPKENWTLDLWDTLVEFAAWAWRIRERPEPLAKLAKVCDDDVVEYADDPAHALQSRWSAEVFRVSELTWQVRPFVLPEEVADFESRLVLR
jgi:hypothetical protein